MSVVAVIPARSGSKSIKDKNIVQLGGYPLLAFSIKAALSCNRIDKVYLSTDSEEYAEIGRQFGAEVPFLRPKEAAKDDSTDLEWVQHFLAWHNKEEGSDPEVLVHLRPTTPLRHPEIIATAIDIFREDTAATALRSVHLMSQTAYKCFELEEGYLKLMFSEYDSVDGGNRPRAEYPQTYEPNGYVDVLSPSFIRVSGKLHGTKVVGFETTWTPDVDTEQDLELLTLVALQHEHLMQTLFAEEKQ